MNDRNILKPFIININDYTVFSVLCQFADKTAAPSGAAEVERLLDVEFECVYIVFVETTIQLSKGIKVKYRFWFLFW